MKRRLAAIGIVVSFGISFSPRQLLAQAAPPPQSTQQSSAGSVNGSAAAIPTYPDAPEGLEHLMKDMLKLQTSGDAKALAPYVQSLILPSPNAWFTATFGEKLGTPMSAEYDRTQLNLPLSFPDTLRQIEAKHMNNVEAHLFRGSCDVEAGDSGYALLISRAREQPLYDVRFTSHKETAILAYFAYVDGAFRYISNFRISNPAITILKVGGNVMAKKEVDAPVPRYPEQAKLDHVSGAVAFHAIIGPSGHVCSLQVVQGPPILVAASFEAVRRWTYSPTTLNGHPVAIDTTITVIFTLGE